MTNARACNSLRPLRVPGRQFGLPILARRARPKGFTLVEILVCILILSILVALTVPAIQYARESARHASCKNNLHQIMLGISNYQASFANYPSGGNGRSGFSFYCAILPFLERPDLYNSINFSPPSHRPFDRSNSTALTTRLAVFSCPSDVYAQSSILPPSTSYAGNGGGGFQSFGYNGVFAPGNALSLGPEHVTDGLSSTVAISEWKVGQGSGMNRDVDRIIFRTPVLEKAGEFDAFLSACENAKPDPDSLQTSSQGHYWINGGYMHTIYNHVLIPNSRSCFNGDFFVTGSWSAGSCHQGGANVAFLDGHCQFISSGIQMPIWRSMSSRAANDFFSIE